MIRVKDYIDEIVEKCFSDEAKAILEFNVKGLSISTKDQFLYHYETACYLGDKESMIRAIAYKVHQAADQLLRIENYQNNLVRVFDLGEYSKVKRGSRTQLDTQSTIGAMGSESRSTSNRTDNYQSTDKNRDININDNRAGASETNELQDINHVIPQATITEEGALNNPQVLEGEDQIGFQRFTKDLTTSDTLNTNTSNSQRSNEDTTTNKLSSASTSVRGGKTDEATDEVTFVVNDARYKM